RTVYPSQNSSFNYLSLRFRLIGDDNTVSFVFQHKQIMIQTVLVQIPVTLCVLTRGKEVYAVEFCFCDYCTFINNNPVEFVANRSKSFSEVMLCVEPCNIPYLDEFNTV